MCDECLAGYAPGLCAFVLVFLFVGAGLSGRHFRLRLWFAAAGFGPLFPSSFLPLLDEVLVNAPQLLAHKVLLLLPMFNHVRVRRKVAL